MTRLGDLPFRHRLMLVMTLTTGSALVVAGAGLLALEAVQSSRRAAHELASLAELVAANSGAALAFGDAAAAQETVESLRGLGDVACAGLYDPRGGLVAGYCRPEAGALPPSPGADRLVAARGSLSLVRPVVVGGERAGTLLVRASLEPIGSRLRGYGLTLLLITLAAMAAATAISARLQRAVSQPVLTLAETARAVARDGNYSLRAPRLGGGELGRLTADFNDMLAHIEVQDGELRQARDELRLWLAAQGEDLRHESDERRRAEQFRDRLVQAVQSSREMISIADPDDCLLFVNRAFLETYGYREDEVIGRHVSLVLSPNNPPGLREEIVAATLAGGWQGELLNVRKDGTEFPAFLSTSATRDSRGAVVLFGVARDITEQRARETRLRLQEAALAATVDAVVITDRDGTIEWVNPAFTRLTGYAPAEAVGRNPRFLKSGKQGTPFYAEMWDTLLEGRVWYGQLVNRRRDGSHYTEEMTITPVCDDGGRIARFVAIKRDISERLVLESSLQGARRLEALGQLAGGVAHDFNNLLGVIRGHGELLAGQLTEPDPRRDKVERILEASQRAARLVRQLLAVGRQQVLAPRVVNLNDLVTGAEGLLRRLVGEHVQLVVTPGPDLGRVRVDPAQIDQVLLNLAGNARDAMPRGGRLEIETANVEVGRREARANEGARAGSYVRLRVRDTGVGMDEKTRSRIFEPFFTTKEIGAGNGLGLATVYGIVKQSGGFVRVESTPGAGARFDIHFPRVEAPIEPRQPTPPPRAAPAGGATILLVEDEPSLRDIAQELLEASGYVVLAAASGAQALELAATQADAGVELLLTDVVMPGMSGLELAQRIQGRWPDVRVLFMSGYSEQAVRNHGELGRGSRLLAKPFSLDALVRAVEDALAVPPPSAASVPDAATAS